MSKNLKGSSCESERVNEVHGIHKCANDDVERWKHDDNVST